MEIGRIKRELGLPVYSPEREAFILDRVARENPGPLDATAVRRVFERIIDESRRLERIACEAEAQAGARKKRTDMVIVMKPSATEEQVQKVIEVLVGVGYDVHRSTGVNHTVLGAVGSPRERWTRAPWSSCPGWPRSSRSPSPTSSWAAPSSPRTPWWTCAG